jgi:hypothetical protein
MLKTNLELEVEALRQRINEIAERVRVDAVAKAWLAGNHDIREGDYFLLNGDYVTKLDRVSREGKWMYTDRAGCIEPFRIPDQADHDRLYTKAEVAEIVSCVARKPAHEIETPPHEGDQTSIDGMIRRLAVLNGFATTTTATTVTAHRYGIDSFVGSPSEALAYLTGWDRCAKNEGR